MLAPDTILQSRYRVVPQLGQGGMGAVYEAVDERLDSTVALKETLFADERLRKQFEREARLLARLHHPALPRVSDHFSEGDGQFLIMQYIGGEDLAEMVAQRRGPFPPDQVLTWADQLLDALDYLHTQEPQIVHRDIKPQNLKLTSRGQIILLDFGLAKGQAGELSRITTSASIFGYTPNYAPLEQIQGLGTDARSDIYCLAATAYHLMTGVKPPDALTRAAAIVNGQPDPLQNAADLNGAIDIQVASVLQRAMSQNREQRYLTAAEMRRALDGTDQAATVSSRGEAATMLFPPEAAALSGATQPAGQETVGRQPSRPTAETTVVRTPAVSERRRFSPGVIAAAAIVVLGLCVGGFFAFQRRQTSPVNQVLVNPQTTLPQTPIATQTPTRSPERQAPNAPSDNAVAPEEKKAAAAEKQPTRLERSAKAGEKKAASASKRESNDSVVDDGHNKIAVPKEPDVPDPDEAGPPPGRPKVTRAGGVVIRKFPDGSQLITTPDGSRVFVTPDGRRRVFHRGEKFQRRRMP